MTVLVCVCVGLLAGLTTHEYLATMSALGQRSLADYPGAGSLVGSDYSLNLEGELLEYDYLLIL